eukprot:15350267-Ditylum_brightwellii.AAC.1
MNNIVSEQSDGISVECGLVCEAIIAKICMKSQSVLLSHSGYAADMAGSYDDDINITSACQLFQGGDRG